MFEKIIKSLNKFLSLYNIKMYVHLNNKFYKIHKNKNGSEYFNLKGKRETIDSKHVVVQRRSKTRKSRSRKSRRTPGSKRMRSIRKLVSSL